VVEVAAAQPDEEPLGQSRHPGADLAPAPPNLVEVAPADAREEGGVRELEIRHDEPTEGLAVRPCQAGELLVVGLCPYLQEVGEHSGVVLSEPRLRRRLGEAELAHEPAEELRGTPGLGCELGIGLRERRGLGQEETEVLV
jgi:hypothetical protein